jgi:hypothetical protein
MNDYAALVKRVAEFGDSAELIRLSAYYAQPSIFSALGVARDEQTHSEFLAWLLTPTARHGLGDLPLRKLLSTLAVVCGALRHGRGRLPTTMLSTLLAGTYALSGVTVKREKAISGGRADVYLRGELSAADKRLPFQLLIENKVKSTERAEQTRRYQAFLDDSPLSLGVYLTPLNNRSYEALDEPECAGKRFIQLNYQYLADRVLEPCLAAAKEPLVAAYIKAYLLVLGLPETRQNRGDVIMAISKQERELLADFWAKHSELIIAALHAVVDSDTLEEDDRAAVKSALDTISKPTFDYTQYEWIYGGELRGPAGKGRTVLHIISHYANNHEECSLGDVKAVFPDSLISTLGVAANADAIPASYQKRYFADVISLRDCAARVCSQWTLANFERFIKYAEIAGYTIRPAEGRA